MARKPTKLEVDARGPGNHHLGDGLYLRVSGGSRTYSFRFQRDRKTRWVSLGSFKTCTLAQARQKALEFRLMLANGQTPESPRMVAYATPAESAPPPVPTGKTFGEVAGSYIDAHKPGWKSAKHGSQWQATLDQHAGSLMAMPVVDIQVQHVLAVLRPIWNSKTETATRVRGRIESILDAARAEGLRTGENPARWKGHLDALLAPPGKLKNVEHHKALPWQDMPGTMAKLMASKGTAARCVAFATLTATRSSEARGAVWSEIDMQAATWTIPAARMKAKREHRVPLSSTALVILAEMQAARTPETEFVFPGGKRGAALSDVSTSKALHVASGDKTTTVHGLRSTFRDWCDEVAEVAEVVAELSLAHQHGDETQRAYARSNLFDRRRALMQQWADYCLPTSRTGEETIPEAA